LKNLKKIACRFMYWDPGWWGFLDHNDNDTGFTRTVVSRFKLTLIWCMIYRWEAENLSKMALPITQTRPITIWGPFWLHHSYIKAIVSLVCVCLCLSYCLYVTTYRPGWALFFRQNARFEILVATWRQTEIFVPGIARKRTWYVNMLKKLPLGSIYHAKLLTLILVLVIVC